MNKQFKVLAIVAITAMVLCIPPSAQQLSAQTSNLRTATQRVYGTDVDNFMSVRDFSTVNMEKWFGMIGGNAGGYANFGFATTALPIYLGFWYQGYLLNFESEYFKSLETDWDLVNKGWDEWDKQTTGETYGNGTYYYDVGGQTQYRRFKYFRNDLNALVGVNIGALPMGFKAGFYQSITADNTPINAARNNTTTTETNFDGTEVTITNVQKEYDYRSGSLIPSIEWGTRIALGEEGRMLLPRVRVGVNIYQSKIIDEWVDTEVTTAAETVSFDERYNINGSKGNSIDLDILAGVNFDLSGAVRFGIDYNFAMDIYGNVYKNKYGFEGFEEKFASYEDKVRGTVNWNNSYKGTVDTLTSTETTDFLTLSITEYKYQYHSITPLFRYRATLNENVKLGTLIQVPVSITPQTYTSGQSETYETVTTTYKDDVNALNNNTRVVESYNKGTLYKYNYFSVAPSIGVGMTGNATEKFTVSGGFTVRPFSYSKSTTITTPRNVPETVTTTTTTTTYENGQVDVAITGPTDTNKTVQDSVSTDSQWTGFSGSAAVGFTFAFNEHVALDFLAGTAFNFDWMDVNLLLTLKY